MLPMSDQLVLTITSDGHDIPAVEYAARSFMRSRGASSAEADIASFVVAGLTQWVARICFPAPAHGRIIVTLTAGDDGVQITLADDGIPLPPFGSSLGPIPAELNEVDQLAVDLHMLNLGTAGKNITCLVPTERPLAKEVQDEVVRESVAPEEIDCRLAQPADAQSVGRVIHAVYGLEYIYDAFYDSQQLIEAWERGDIISAVATVRGHVVAHMAFFRESSGRVLESGAAAVDPRYRGLGLTAMLGAILGAEALSQDVLAISVHMVTIHSRTQSAPAKMGFVATGLLIGAAPDPISHGPRQALLLAYLPLQRLPRPVALPSEPSYIDALVAVYNRMGLELVPQDSDAALAEVGDAPDIELAPHYDANTPAVITIRRYGPEQHNAVIDTLREAVTSGVPMVYVDLDLHTLTSTQLDEIQAFLRYYDFFAAGLLIYSHYAHDHLRLQAMLSRDVEIDDMVLLTDEARLVRAAVFLDHSKLAERIKG